MGPRERAYLARVRNGIPIDNGCAPGPGWGLYPLGTCEAYGDFIDIGSQDDARTSALIVSGVQVGRVVRRDDHKVEEPYFYRAANFLDWYEGWLDEILSDEST